MPSPPSHLLPDFNPATVKVATLRNILLQHDVPHLSTAKKVDLVLAFEKHVRPQAAAALATYNQIQPSDHGILDGESQNGSLLELDTDSAEEAAPVARKPTRKVSTVAPKSTPRIGGSSLKNKGKGKDKKVTVDEDGDEEMSGPDDERDSSEVRTLPSRAAGPSKVPSKRRLGSSGPDAFKRVKGEDVSPDKYDSGPESGFSDFNPFQSGGEDSPESKAARRKSSMGPSRQRMVSGPLSGRKSLPAPRSNSDFVGSWNNDIASSSPDRPTFIASETVVDPSRRSSQVGVRYMAPLDQVKKIPTEIAELQRRLGDFEPEKHISHDESIPSPPSLHTPSQKVDSVARVGGRDRNDGTRMEYRKTPMPKRQSVGSGRRFSDRLEKLDVVKVKPSRAGFPFLPLLIALFVYSLWWREESIAAGFCDTAKSTNDQVASRTGSLVLPSWLPSLPRPALSLIDSLHLRPSCTPCPPHATCRNGVFVSCKHDYIVKLNPFALGGLIPLSPTCRPDSAKVMAVAVEASSAAKLMRKRRGEVVCGKMESSRRKEGKSEAWTYGVEAEALVDTLRQQWERTQGSSSEEAASEIISLALSDLRAHDEVIIDEIDGETWYASKVADLPILCRLRLAVKNRAKQYKLEISGVLLGLIGLLRLRSLVQSRKTEQTQVRQLVQTALQLLRDQERLHHTDAVLAPTSAVAASHLRDLVLQNEHSLSRRKGLWNLVEKVVEGNANVRAKQIELSGEEVRAWEWTGGSRVTWQQQTEGPSLYPEL